MDPVLVIGQRPARLFDEECLRRPAEETGAVLSGVFTPHAIVVPCLIPAGPRAYHARTGFSPDCAFQQLLLDWIFAHLGLNFVGEVHRHPGSLDRPSRYDLKTARGIVTSNEWDTPKAVFPIAVIENGHARMRAYYMTREEPDFREIPIEIVPDTDPRIRAALLGEPASTHEGEGHVSEVATRCRPRGAWARALRALAARVRLHATK